MALLEDRFDVNDFYAKLSAMHDTQIQILEVLTPKKLAPISFDTPSFKAEDEAALIKDMKKMRKKGATYKEIAHFLNTHDIPTFSNKGRWYAQSVHRLCEVKHAKRK